MIASASQCALKLMLLQLGWLWASLMKFHATASQSSMPMMIEFSVMNEDSSRKLSRTIRRLEAGRSQHADLLAAFDHCPCADHAERCHAGDQT